MVSTAAQIGFVLETIVVVVSSADVVTDILLAWQLQSMGHLGWAKAIWASIITAGALYVLMAIEWEIPKLSPRFEAWRNKRPIAHRILAAVLLLPVSQLIPLALWAYPKRKNRQEKKNRVWHKTSEASSGTESKPEKLPARLQVAAASEKDLQFAAVLNATVLGLQSHGMFIVEAVVESVPQLVVQFLAAAAIGIDASPIQFYSFVASLVSLTVKAHTLCTGSFARQVVWWKCACMAFDIFSFFLGYATLGAGTDPAIVSWTPFSGLPYSDVWKHILDFEPLLISNATAAWLTKFVWISIIDIFTVGIFLFVLGYDNAKGRKSSWTIPVLTVQYMSPIVLTFIFCLAAVPFLLLADAFRLSMLVALLSPVEPPTSIPTASESTESKVDPIAAAHAVFFPWWRSGSSSKSIRCTDPATERETRWTSQRDQRLRATQVAIVRSTYDRSTVEKEKLFWSKIPFFPGSSPYCFTPTEVSELLQRKSGFNPHGIKALGTWPPSSELPVSYPPIPPFDSDQLPCSYIRELGLEDEKQNEQFPPAAPTNASATCGSTVLRLWTFFYGLDYLLKVNLVMWIILIATQIPSCIFGLLWPFWHAFTLYDMSETSCGSLALPSEKLFSQITALRPGIVCYNSIQLFCILICIVSLITVTILTPFVLDYARYGYFMSWLSKPQRIHSKYSRVISKESAVETVVQCSRPNFRAVLRWAIAPSVMPMSLVDEVAQHVPEKAFELPQDWCIEESEEICKFLHE